VDRIIYGEPHLYRGELIRCQSDYGDYTCFCGGASMSGGDGMNSSTRVPVYQVLSYVALTDIAIRGPRFSGHSPGTQDTPRRGYRGPGRVLCWGARVSWTGLTGGEIMLTHGH
jgi:hypothetical protein